MNTRTNEINTPYSTEYNTGRVIRHEKGKPVYLWDTAYFERKQYVNQFIKNKKFGRYFEK